MEILLISVYRSMMLNTYFYKNDKIVPYHTTWRLHQMEAFSALLALCAWNHRSPVNSLERGQWQGALMFSSIFAWTNGRVNNRDTGNLNRHHAHYGVTVMILYWSRNMPGDFDTLLVNVLAYWVASSPAAVLLTIFDKWILLIHEEQF